MIEATVNIRHSPLRSSRKGRMVRCTADGDDAELLAIRLVREATAVDALLQLWVDSALDKLEQCGRTAVAAFYSWLNMSGHRPRSAGYVTPVVTALITALEETFVDNTPAFDRAYPTFLDTRLELLCDWRPRYAHTGGDPLMTCVDDLGVALRAALVEFGVHLRAVDEAAWNVVGVCLVADSPNLTFVRRVLHERGGLPDVSTDLIHSLWAAMVNAYCDWEHGGIVADLKRSLRGEPAAARES